MENAIWNGESLVAYEVAEDYEVEKQVRMASYRGELRCPDEGCLSPILKYCHGEIREPYFAHRDNAECDYVLFEKNADKKVCPRNSRRLFRSRVVRVGFISGLN